MLLRPTKSDFIQHSALACLLLTFFLAGAAPAASEAVHPSMEEFNRINNTMADDPSARDYPAILAKLRTLCEKYPGSEASQMAFTMVKEWQSSGHITEAQAAPFVELRRTFNPAEKDFREIQELRIQAEKTGNASALEEAASRLESLRDRYRGSYAGYVAMAALPEVYQGLGKKEEALKSVRAFSAAYDPRTTDYVGASSYEHSNVFADARLTASVEGYDAGIAKYMSIAEAYGNRKSYQMPALFEAGDLAMAAGKPADATEYFSRLVKAYPDGKEEVLIVAQFRVGEAMLRMGQIREALALFEELGKKYSSTRFAKDAAAWVDLAKRAMNDPRVLPWSSQQAGNPKLNEALQFYVYSTGEKNVGVDYSDILDSDAAPRSGSITPVSAKPSVKATVPADRRFHREFVFVCAIIVSTLLLAVFFLALRKTKGMSRARRSQEGGQQ